MTADIAPNFTRKYPMAGERLGPSWQALWDHLNDFGWHTVKCLQSTPGLTIADRTVENLLRNARIANKLDRRYRITKTGRIVEYRRFEPKTQPKGK
jgi:hypothetical protein